MIAGQKGASIRQDVFGPVPKFILPFAGDNFSLHQVEIGAESNPSQGNDDAQIFKPFEFALQKRSAADQFLGPRFVLGRYAAGGVGDVEIRQHLPIFASSRSVAATRIRFHATQGT